MVIEMITALFNWTARKKLKNFVTIGHSSTIEWRKISSRSGCRMMVGTNSLISATVSFDRDNAVVLVGDRTFIGASNIVCANRVTIGDDVLISWGCTIVDHNSHSVVWEERKDDVVNWQCGRKEWQYVKISSVNICSKAWLGFNSIILKGVTIGEGAIVAAGSVVTRDVDPYTVVAGNPAKFVRALPRHE